MNDQRFFTVLLVGFGAFVIGGVIFLNIEQPKGVDVEVWNRITAPATSIIGLLILMVNSNARSKQIADKVIEKTDQQTAQVKEIVAAQPKEMKIDATVHPPV